MIEIKTMPWALILSVLMIYSCASEDVINEEEIPAEVLTSLQNAGYEVSDVLKSYEDDGTFNGYIVENDILITRESLEDLKEHKEIPSLEQYATDNLVTGLPRVITVFMPNSFGRTEQRALNLAIRAYNRENLRISFQRTNSSANADIVFSRLSRLDELLGVLGSAGFPTNSGDPFGSIRLSGVLQSSFGLDVGAIATIIGHEMGHCIGFRHTDFFDRSISCGGNPVNEGDGDVGANLIPGTTSGADLEGNGSWMLACSDGSTRRFTTDDRTALNFLY